MERSGRLLSGEGNALAAALIFEFARSKGIRALIVKGASLRAHGLPREHESVDVDVLVEPGRHAELVAVMQSFGWYSRATTKADRILAAFSVTLSNPRWPNDIDAHACFPGILRSAESAFTVLWSARQEITVAGEPAWIPDKVSTITIWALHCLRGSGTQPRHDEELQQIVRGVLPELSETERRKLASRIVELAADEPLRVVPEFAEIIGDRHGPQAPGALEAWQAKMAQAHEATPWLQVLRDARPAERPWLLFRAVWPSAHDVRITDEALVDTPLGRVQSRGRRAWRLVRRIVERRRQAH